MGLSSDPTLITSERGLRAEKEVDSIADLQVIPEVLCKRGYAEEDIGLIMHGNWIRKLNETLPE